MQTSFLSFRHSVIAIALVALSLATARAQERQLSFDSAHAVMRIDKGLEHSLGLFPNISSFEEAYLYQRQDSTYVVEVTRDSSHVITRQTINWTAAERDSAERRISEFAHREHPELYMNQEGRGTLMIGIMGLSLLGYGPAVPVILGMEDPAQITGAYLLLGGGSFLVASSLTSRMEVTKGEAQFATSGGILGYAHGALLTLMLEGDEPDAKSMAAISSIASIGEMIANYHIAKNNAMTPGTASVLNSCALYGGVDGLAAAWFIDRDPDVRALSGLGLASSIGGYFLGDVLARDHSYQEGDASALNIATLLGTILPVANLAANNVEDHTVLASSVILGSVAGAAIAHTATRNTGFNSSQGGLLGLGTIAGTLMGTGFALLAKSDAAGGVLLASLGTVAGYGITFGMLSNTEHVTTGSAGEGRGTEGSSLGQTIEQRLQLQVNPAAVVVAARSNSANNRILSLQYHL